MIMPVYLTTCLVSMLLLLTGCAGIGGGGTTAANHYAEVDVSKIPDPVPKHEPRSRYGNPAHYRVFGKTYYVRDTAHPFKERGLASWYGHPFHGRRTSSGEPYDMYQMTAAHKSVPIPCYMRVKNLRTGRSIIVRVNDRGPFHEGRIIDLSYVAAKKLGVHAAGTVEVEIEVVTHKPSKVNVVVNEKNQSHPVALTSTNHTTPHQPATLNSTRPVYTTPTTQPGFYLQVAALHDQQRAEHIARHLQQQLSSTLSSQVMRGYNHHHPIYRVRIGPFADHNQAQAYASKIVRIYPDTRPVVVH